MSLTTAQSSRSTRRPSTSELDRACIAEEGLRTLEKSAAGRPRWMHPVSAPLSGPRLASSESSPPLDGPTCSRKA